MLLKLGMNLYKADWVTEFGWLNLLIKSFMRRNFQELLELVLLRKTKKGRLHVLQKGASFFPSSFKVVNKYMYLSEHI